MVGLAWGRGCLFPGWVLGTHSGRGVLDSQHGNRGSRGGSAAVGQERASPREDPRRRESFPKESIRRAKEPKARCWT